MYCETKILSGNSNEKPDISSIASYAIAAINSTAPLSKKIIDGPLVELKKARGLTWSTVFNRIHNVDITELVSLPGATVATSTSKGKK